MEKKGIGLLFLLVVAATAPIIRAAPAGLFGPDNVPISIKLPDSEELVKTDVPGQSAIPECLKTQDGVTETENGLVVPAEAFTLCARKELGRLQTELKPTTPEPEDSSEEEQPEEDDIPPPAKPAAKEEKKEEPEPPKEKAPAPPKEEKPFFPEAPKIPDLTSITDAFTKTKPIDKNPTILGDVVKVLQVIFDFKRVMSDMQRILHGDIKGVLQEYPGRARGFFRMVHSLPSRFSSARDTVEEVQKETEDPEYAGTLSDLNKYLSSAGESSRDLPNALSLVSTLDTLRSIAARLHNRVTSAFTTKRAADQSGFLSGRSRSGVMDDIKDIFLTIPDTFRSYARRSKLNGGPGIFSPSPVSPLSPWSPLNPLSPISPISQISRLTPGDPLGPVSKAQVGAVDAISRRLTDLFNPRKGARDQ
ncbi:hypothetical protein HPB48_022449 [Haemaphysalis longicornis]|uniref:Secreted protein n=1 Tax=Haemaphysalis longicornis TaxID=44386 RepID=A0A9J6FT97_HAELO|nr:hypothetical protein HPB48_022449 [Haemaphysalis longicornis]